MNSFRFGAPRRWVAPAVPAFALALALVLGGCASSGPPTPRMAGGQPMVSVERFLQAANTGDLEAMAHIFGTADGPISEGMGNPFSCGFRRVGSWIGLSDRCVSWAEVELRMNAIALVLQHDVYRLRTEASVPGRQRPTVRVGVDIEEGVNRYPDVPFVVVQARDGRWLVEQIALERITQGP
jgi:hypothetical protein